MAGRRIALDKSPVVIEVLRRLIARYVLSVAKGESQEACGMEKLSGELQTGIKGGVHAIHSIWNTNEMDTVWGCLLIYLRLIAR